MGDREPAKDVRFVSLEGCTFVSIAGYENPDIELCNADDAEKLFTYKLTKATKAVTIAEVAGQYYILVRVRVWRSKIKGWVWLAIERLGETVAVRTKLIATIWAPSSGADNKIVVPAHYVDDMTASLRGKKHKLAGVKVATATDPRNFAASERLQAPAAHVARAARDPSKVRVSMTSADRATFPTESRNAYNARIAALASTARMRPNRSARSRSPSPPATSDASNIQAISDFLEAADAGEEFFFDDHRTSDTTISELRLFQAEELSDGESEDLFKAMNFIWTDGEEGHDLSTSSEDFASSAQLPAAASAEPEADAARAQSPAAASAEPEADATRAQSPAVTSAAPESLPARACSPAAASGAAEAPATRVQLTAVAAGVEAAISPSVLSDRAAAARALLGWMQDMREMYTKANCVIDEMLSVERRSLAESATAAAAADEAVTTRTRLALIGYMEDVRGGNAQVISRIDEVTMASL